MADSKVVPMVLHRNATLASILGHIIDFKKGKVINVPATLVREAVAMGAETVDGSDPFAPSAEEAPSQPVSPIARLEEIRAVVDAMAEENLREDFTASGTPKVANVSARVGFKVDRNEVSKVWSERAIDLAK